MSPQHDFVIDNGTGSAVRADLNNLFKAILTNNSGTTDPSTVISSDAGSKAFSFWADTNSSPAVLKIRNAADDGWIELFQLDGTITLEDGTVSAPALAARNDLNTGVFFSAADKFNVATEGTERMELGSTTIFNEDGADVDFRIEGDTEPNLFYVDAGNDRVAIGTSSPLADFHVALTGTSTSVGANFITLRSGASGRDAGIQFADGTTSAYVGMLGGAIYFADSGSSEIARFDTSGRFMIGTTTEGNESGDELTINSSGNTGITLRTGSSANGSILFSDGTSGTAEYAGFVQYQHASDELVLGAATVSVVKIHDEHFNIFAPEGTLRMNFGFTNSLGGELSIYDDGGNQKTRITGSTDTHHFFNNGGSVGIGVTSPAQKLHIDGASNDPFVLIQRSGAGDSAVDIGGFQMKNSTNVLADIRCRSIDINDGFLKFSAMKAGTLTERQRFSANTASVYIGRVGGEVSVGSDDRSFTEGIGVTLAGGGETGGSYNVFTADNTTTMYIGRQFSDGQIIQFRQAGSEEGNIAVNGSTVSYNGGHLSRWSQLAGISSTDKSARPTIYQGTVLSNLDELCSWSHPDVLYTEEDEKNDDIPDGKKVGDIRRAAYTEDNQQLNITKISDIEGDKDVAGVFWAWDDDDDEIVNDFYVAMTGDMVIRVAASTTVARGDLLISAGDGTAKPQADDIIRSSTIAKIISTNHTATYADGSKAYPCVLMAC